MRFSLLSGSPASQSEVLQFHRQSTAFKERESRLKQELEPFFREDYGPNFVGLTARSFRAGSIVHSTDLTFHTNTSIPTEEAIFNTMIRAGRSGTTTLPITHVNGTALITSLVSSTTSLFKVWNLGVASLLLLAQWLAH
ncbi:hypothetical protein AALO_G00090340 [Alosa alosa]|uniref:SEA domain-containing protein n=1 Tax=Alosa alosa TaxID=278164 RepID=A0AAV6GRC5_9TELE|nr:hypothetical protein AALO_G00090340 [Alosa alosa]